MDLFMPAERVLYNRSYYFSDEAVDDYNEYIADRDGVNVDVVSSLDFFMNEVWKEIDYAIDNDLSDEISRFDRMLRDLKCGGDPEHPTEISVVAKGAVERWDEPSRGLVVADSLLSLVQGTGSADALKDCQIDRLVDTNGDFHIEASHHDGSAYLDVRLISGISYDAKGFKLGGEYYAPGKMDLADFYILLDNLYDSPGVGPCSLPRFAERAYGTARESSAAVCTSTMPTSPSRRRSSSGSAIRRPAPSSALKPARPSWATRPRPAPCMYRPPRSARPSAADRPSTGSITTMGTSRSRRRSSSSRRRAKAARALRRWLPRRRPPRGIALRVPITASTVFNIIGVRYNRCGR